MSIPLSKEVSKESQYLPKLKKREFKANRKQPTGKRLGLEKSDVSKLIDSYHNLVGLIRENQNYGSHASYPKKSSCCQSRKSRRGRESSGYIISLEESDESETNLRVNNIKQIEAKPRSEMVNSNVEKDDEIVNRDKLSLHQVLSYENIRDVSALNTQNPPIVIEQKDQYYANLKSLQNDSDKKVGACTETKEKEQVDGMMNRRHHDHHSRTGYFKSNLN